MNKDILNYLNTNKKKNKIYNLTVDEVIYLKDKLSFEKYCIYVENYLYSRIKNNIICTREELQKLKILYEEFNKDERTSLKYMQKLFGYIDDLKYISNNYSKSNNENVNVNNISIKKLISLHETTYLAKYISYVKKYLNNRINKKIYISEKEIYQLKSLVDVIVNLEDIRQDQIKDIKKLITKLIIISKYKDKKNFVKRLSNINIMSLDELYSYLETIVKYAYFCYEDINIESIITLFKKDIKYLNKIETLLKNSDLNANYDELLKSLKSEHKIFNKNYPNINIKYDYLDKELPFKENKNIITIDELYSPDLDGAFSVEKKGNMYILEVYVTDVPSFLLQNEDLMIDAYKRAFSIYNNQNPNRFLILDMLPEEISHDFLSLKKGKTRNAITFTYEIDKDGNVNLKNIARNSIYINDNINPKTATKLITNSSVNNTTHTDLKLYREICNLVSNRTQKKYLNSLNLDKIESIVGVPSILTNYHVGMNSNLAIYRDNGIYTKESDNKYTHSVTPLRKFVSDINLALYLNQLGIINCPNKYIYYIEDHLEEIIDHLNQQEQEVNKLQKNYRLMKKYFE